MASSFAVQAPEDVLNLVFARLGFRLRLGSIYDGSDHAKKALDIYSQTRDALLRSSDWPFAQREIAPTLLKSAPANGYVPPNIWNPANFPPLPWKYEYAWPSDCLEARALRPQPVFLPNYDPQPVLFKIVNDNSFTPPQRVIVSDISNPCLVYTGQVTDPNTWPNDFSEALAASLGRRLAPLFGSGQNATQLEAADEQGETALAMEKTG